MAFSQRQRDAQLATRQQGAVHHDARTRSIGTHGHRRVAEDCGVKRHGEFIRPLITDRLCVQGQEGVASDWRGHMIHINHAGVIEDDQVGRVARHSTVDIGDDHRVASGVRREDLAQGQGWPGDADEMRAVINQVRAKPPPLVAEGRRAIDIDAKLSRGAGDQVRADGLVQDDRPGHSKRA